MIECDEVVIECDKIAIECQIFYHDFATEIVMEITKILENGYFGRYIFPNATCPRDIWLNGHLAERAFLRISNANTNVIYF